MVTAIIFGFHCILLLRWIIWETTRCFEQEWELIADLSGHRNFA